MPAYTFPATANVVALSGLRPVLVDVDPVTMNIDPAQDRGRAADEGDHRRAPLRPPGPDRGAARPAADRGRGRRARRAAARPRLRLARPDGLPQLPPAEDRHDRRGRRGHDRRRAASPPRSRRLRNHGWRSLADADMPAPGPQLPPLGHPLRASGLPQLRRLDELLAARTRIAAAYAERLARPAGRRCPTADEGDVHGWQAYVIQVERRDEVLAALRAQGIEAQIGTFALHLLDAYRDQGAVPGRRARVRARARAAVPHAPDRVASSTGSPRPLTSL